jgi:hypothetical protein
VNKNLFFTFLGFFIVQSLTAQNLNGFWKGNLSMRGCFPDNNIELQITIKGKEANGDSYHYQDLNNYVKKKFNGKYDMNSRNLNLQETLITTYHIPGQCTICIKNYDLTYSRFGNVETLSGIWTGTVQNTNASCESGRIILTRTVESAFKSIPEILVDTGTIRLDFYDNAQIDGDSITVLVDKRVVLTHQRLGAKPITTYLKIDLNNSFHEVEMVAENLGSIPPNTAVLIITAGEKRYFLYLSSSESKSAMVRFVYDGEVAKRLETVALAK